jgi:fumarate hydratase class II
MLNQVAYQVYGCDTTVWTAATGAQLELNVMMPVVAWNLLHEIRILGNALDAFTTRCVGGIEADRERCMTLVQWSTAIATALAPKVGYRKAAELAKESFKKGIPVRELVVKKGLMSEKEAKHALDPLKLTKPGVFE